MTFLLLLQLALHSDRLHVPPPPLVGRVVHYAARWDWDLIAQRHNLTIPAGHTPIAHWDCSRLGDTGTLELGGEVLSVFVADCSAPADVAGIRQRNIVAEVPYPVAARLGFVGEGWTVGKLRWGP